jgi:hypothetical protein
MLCRDATLHQYAFTGFVSFLETLHRYVPTLSRVALVPGAARTCDYCM